MTNAVKNFEALYGELMNAETTYARKTIYSKMVELYNKYATIRKLYELVETARHYAKRFIKRVLDALATRRKGKYDAFIDWNCTPWNGETFYLLEIRKEADKSLLWSKVGTSGDIVGRMRDEVRDYSKAVGEQVRLVVNRCYVADDHAQTIRAESAMRAHYIGKFGSACFVDNDRFVGVEFDLAEADEILAEIGVGA